MVVDEGVRVGGRGDGFEPRDTPILAIREASLSKSLDMRV